MKDVQQSIIQLYLQKVTLYVLPQASAISASLKSPNLHGPSLETKTSRTYPKRLPIKFPITSALTQG
jgi:hypothetical protein